MIHTDTDGFEMKTGEREHRSDPWKIVEGGYRVIARRPRSEVFTESIDPERADQIEEFSHGIIAASQTARRARA